MIDIEVIAAQESHEGNIYMFLVAPQGFTGITNKRDRNVSTSLPKPLPTHDN
jgi:hypothetical protein